MFDFLIAISFFVAKLKMITSNNSNKMLCCWSMNRIVLFTLNHMIAYHWIWWWINWKYLTFHLLKTFQRILLFHVYLHMNSFLSNYVCSINIGLIYDSTWILQIHIFEMCKEREMNTGKYWLFSPFECWPCSNGYPIRLVWVFFITTFQISTWEKEFPFFFGG